MWVNGPIKSDQVGILKIRYSNRLVQPNLPIIYRIYLPFVYLENNHRLDMITAKDLIHPPLTQTQLPLAHKTAYIQPLKVDG